MIDELEPQEARYLLHVVEEGDGAETPEEYFDGDVAWGEWSHCLPDSMEFDHPDADDVELTPIELFGLLYLGEDVTKGILEMRLGYSEVGRGKRPR